MSMLRHSARSAATSAGASGGGGFTRGPGGAASLSPAAQAGGSSASDAAAALRAHASAHVKLRIAAARAIRQQRRASGRAGAVLGPHRVASARRAPFRRTRAPRRCQARAGRRTRKNLRACLVSWWPPKRCVDVRGVARLRCVCLWAVWWRSRAGPPSARAPPALSRSAWRARRRTQRRARGRRRCRTRRAP